MRTVQPIRDQEKVHEIENRLEAIKGTNKGWRQYMLFELGIYTGLRVSDLVRLKVDDVRGKEYICMREKKTGKETILPLSQRIQKVCKKELKGRVGNEYIFLSSHKTRKSLKCPGIKPGQNKALDRRTAYNYMDDIKRDAGLDFSVGCHTLRKTFGYHFYQKTKRIGLLTIWFNHSSEEITKRYLGIDLDELTKSVKNFEI